MATDQRAWVIAAAICIGLAVVSYFFLDRAVATVSHDHLHGIPWFVWLTYIPDPFRPAAAVALVIMALRRVARARLCRFDDLVLRLGTSVIVASAIKEQLKRAFGRTWPETWVNNNPSYFGDGSYGFHPFEGGVAYASFPSGHTTLTFSVVSVLWILAPRLRWLWGVIALAVPIGLLGADYHWLSDIIVGAGLGTATGAIAATIGRDAAARGGMA